MLKNPFRRFARTYQDIPDIAVLWMLRMLIPLGAHRKFIEERGYYDDAIACFLGLLQIEEADDDESEFDAKLARASLRRKHEDYERRSASIQVPTRLRDNVARLAESLNLSFTDCRILEFAVLLHSEQTLDDTADWLGQLTSSKAIRAVSILLNFLKRTLGMRWVRGVFWPDQDWFV